MEGDQAGVIPGTDSPLVSMTGFGRADLESDGIRYTVEVRSVNSRYLDCVCKLPRFLQGYEKNIRDAVGSRFFRGRVEVTVDVQRVGIQATAGSINHEFVHTQMEAVLQKAVEYGLSREQYAGTALQLVLQQRSAFDSLSVPELSACSFEDLLGCLDQAFTVITAMTVQEGRQLAKVMDELSVQLSDCRERVLHLLSGFVDKQFSLFKERVALLVKDSPEATIDQSRLITELAVMADKMDVSEELVRIKSHEQQLGDALTTSPCGRKLEFILQEFGREWNTLGVKSQHSEVHVIVVEAKVLLEKLREQAANLV